MFNVLIVEDDKNTRRLMQAVLTGAGYKPFPAADGEAALDVLDTTHIDIIILDVMMPNMDGFEFTKTLRENKIMTPILMVSAKSAPADKKYGFRLGIDDYMTKPVDEEEMLLRIKALLRRSRIASEHKIQIGGVTLDYEALTVAKDGKSELLPKKEFYLLYKLLSYPDIIFTRLQIMDEIWGYDSETDERTINVHINRLRERFKDFPEFEIVTVRGLGYKAIKKA